MTVWILTTGNSDVQLEKDNNWEDLYDFVRNEEPISECDNFGSCDNKNEETNCFLQPARVLGLVYREHPEHYEDLFFPLLNAYVDKIKYKLNRSSDRIIVLLTDQESLFQDEIEEKNCPFWKDTCTLEEILKDYLKQKFQKAQQTFIYLKPKGDKGLDHWDTSLERVQDECSKLVKKFPELEKEREIYVSHQAGTPAISSALQFVSLTRFGKAVKFLVSNEYNSEAELIEASKYLRGIQIEQAKKLVETSPGAAHKLLKKIEDIEPEYLKRLQEYVDFFNLNRSKVSTQDEFYDEFSIESATQRIVDVLDLISIFLSQSNYLQGITLLSAAQETFMKVAILSKTSEMIVTLSGGETFKGKEILEWNHEGLVLSNKVKNKTEIDKILSKLYYPEDDSPKKTNSNFVMLPWLKQLEPNFKSWFLLDWSCQCSRNREDDLRNQLVHNLQGMDNQDVIKYLLGYQNIQANNVMDAYNNHVKDPFLKAIKLFNLPYKRDKLINELKKLANDLS